MTTKTLLVLRASEDISQYEIANLVSQVVMYGIKSDVYDVKSPEDLFRACHSGKKYDYIYLATHGCETSWGNQSTTLNVPWINFGAMICESGVSNPDAIFLHSCCRGGLPQVAYRMFACCPKIDFVCGPRSNLKPVHIITMFNLFLYYVEVLGIDPVRAAEKVQNATDIRLVCHDRADITVTQDYLSYTATIQKDIDKAFGILTDEEMEDENTPLIRPKFGQPVLTPIEVEALPYERFIQLSTSREFRVFNSTSSYMKNLLEIERSTRDLSTSTYQEALQYVKNALVEATNSALLLELSTENKDVLKGFPRRINFSDSSREILTICKEGQDILQLYRFNQAMADIVI